MTSFVRVFVVVMFAAAAVAGQVTGAKDDISQEKYFAAEKKAAELLKKVNYRSVWVKEYFADGAKEGKLQEMTVREVVQPNKWRTVTEEFHNKPKRKEIIADGKAFYFRTDDGPWEKGGLGSSSAYNIFGETVSNQFRYLPEVDLDGKTTGYYELVSIRNPSPSSRNSLFGIRYVHTVRNWYSAEGYLLKKLEETAIETRETILRDTTIYGYNPKDLKIEAPKVGKAPARQ